MKTIEITVTPDGRSNVETHGFIGTECRDASRFLEQALGKPAGETLKPEFRQAATTEQQVRQAE